MSATITLKVGARVYAHDAYWPMNGRPVRKERVIEGAEPNERRLTPDKLSPVWDWRDPKNGRLRWVERRLAHPMTPGKEKTR